MIVGIFLHLIEMKIKPLLFLPMSVPPVKDLKWVNHRRSQYTSRLDRKDRWDATKDGRKLGLKSWGI